MRAFLNGACRRLTRALEACLTPNIPLLCCDFAGRLDLLQVLGAQHVRAAGLWSALYLTRVCGNRQRVCKQLSLRKPRRLPTARLLRCEVRVTVAPARDAVRSKGEHMQLTCCSSHAGGLSKSVERVRTACVDLIAELEARCVDAKQRSFRRNACC
jgi:hypothetical protein